MHLIASALCKINFASYGPEKRQNIMATRTSPALIPQHPPGCKVRSSNPHEPLQILRSAQGLEAAADPVTIGQMFQDTVKMFPKRTALCFKENGGDSDWKEISFAKYYSFTTQAARSLLKV